MGKLLQTYLLFTFFLGKMVNWYCSMERHKPLSHSVETMRRLPRWASCGKKKHSMLIVPWVHGISFQRIRFKKGKQRSNHLIPPVPVTVPSHCSLSFRSLVFLSYLAEVRSSEHLEFNPVKSYISTVLVFSGGLQSTDSLIKPYKAWYI